MAYTEEHSKASVHWHTVLGSSHWSQWGNAVRSTYTRVYNCAGDHRMRLMQLFPLSLHSNGMRPTYTPVRMKSSSWLQQKTTTTTTTTKCAGRFLRHNRRCCTTLAKVRRLKTQTCKEHEQSKVALPEIHWPEDSPAQPLVERDGLRVCAVQWADRLR